jgi:hypothetical protein
VDKFSQAKAGIAGLVEVTVLAPVEIIVTLLFELINGEELVRETSVSWIVK